MKKQTKKDIAEALSRSFLQLNDSPFDVNGSYTGKVFVDNDSEPVQDVDDL